MKDKAKLVRSKQPDEDMMEAHNVSPWYSVGKILPTSPKPKQDIFESFRPKKQCVDYKISETWTKMQGGDVKINVKQTTATYEDIPLEICKPRRKKKVKRFSGGPPQWKFIDEIWRERVLKNQTELKAKFLETTRENHVQKKFKRLNQHAMIQCLVGPEWFMELSPKQLRAVDHLKQGICLDKRSHSTTACEEIIAILGIVLRPNKQHIRSALKHCCECPIEFLLVLYQLIDPKRTSYSLNDRLLLSSVVHLGIVTTLRELHVRIPSPSRGSGELKTVTADSAKKRVKKRYSSPYLAPLTYQPPAPKYRGIYRNKHKQCPESPYFAYLDKLEEEKHCDAVALDFSMLEGHEDVPVIKKEFNDAREFYESLPGRKKFLLPPSFQRLCPNMLNPRKEGPIKQNLIIPLLCKVTLSEPIICFCKESCQKDDNPLKKLKRSCCEKSAQALIGEICLCDDCLEKSRNNNLIRIHGGFQKAACKCDDPVPIIQGTLESKACDCYREYRNKIVACAARQRLSDQTHKCFVGGIVMTKFGPVYNILGNQGGKICLCHEEIARKSHLNKSKEKLNKNEAKFVIGGITITKDGLVYNLTSVVARKPCQCILRYRQQLEVLGVQNNLRKYAGSIVNHGLIGGKFGPLFHLSSTGANRTSESPSVCSCEIKKTKCFQHCMNYINYRDENDSSKSIGESESASSTTDSDGSMCLGSETRSSERTSGDSQTTSAYSLQAEESSVLSLEPKSCRCKEELQRFMNAKCPCEECNRKIRRGYATHIMGGIKNTDSGNQINIVQGIHQPLCSCMYDHLKQTEKIDQYRNRVKARYDLRKQTRKYCISGVRNTPQGPVYIISGIRPPVECECGKAVRENEEFAAFEKQRAKLTNIGRAKYEISGVKAMPGENVYIMSRALKAPPCACEKLLDKFEMAHQDCMEAFQTYLEYTVDETREYVNEISPADHRSTLLDDPNVTSENAAILEENVEQDIDEKSSIPSNTLENLNLAGNDAGFHNESEEESSEDDELSSSESSSADSISDESECGSCHVDNPPDVIPITVPHKTLPESFLSKRFAIFRKLPRCKKTFMKILRHILEGSTVCATMLCDYVIKIPGMAEDGFPLAKLPQVHKLPIFKLWMELRLRTCWTSEDKIRYHRTSKYLWNHTHVCYSDPRPARMPFSLEEVKRMSWTHAKRIRRMAGEQMNSYYRNLKQATVETAREFFATTYPYEFPTPTWRDCAFAYLPTKEEDTFPYKIVQPHDVRSISDNKRIDCYC